MAEAREDWANFGPDATFSAIANWLTTNVDLIDDLFSSLLRITHIRLGERMMKPHPAIPGQGIAPSLQVAFDRSSSDEYRSGHGPRTRKRLEFVEQAWHEKFTKLKRHCVIRDDIYYQEALDLTIWQGGAAFGMLRCQGIEAMRMSADRASPEYEIAEQYFIWTRRGDRYVGDRLEIRLWGLYLPNFIAEGGNALGEIRADPPKLLTSPDILPGRDTGYVALYQMQRPPTRVDIGRKTISAIYEGENDAARVVLGRAEV